MITTADDAWGFSNWLWCEKWINKINDLQLYLPVRTDGLMHSFYVQQTYLWFIKSDDSFIIDYDKSSVYIVKE